MEFLVDRPARPSISYLSGVLSCCAGCVALCCVAISCVLCRPVVLHCVALCCNLLFVVWSGCVVLRCVVLLSCIVSVLF